MDEMNKNDQIKDAELEEVSGGAADMGPNDLHGTWLCVDTYKGCQCNVYKVGSGDYLSAICLYFRNNCSPAEYKKLARFNGIQNPDLINVGQIIYIPIGYYSA